MLKHLFLSTALLLGCFIGAAMAQKPVDPQIQRDPILEADAKHNLDVARQYFKLKKAYKAVLLRLEETIAAYPEFSRMDEVLYLSGLSALYLSEGKGKQKIDYKNLSDDEKKRWAPEKLREDAIGYFSSLVDNHAKSEFKAEAEKLLKEIKDKQ